MFKGKKQEEINKEEVVENAQQEAGAQENVNSGAEKEENSKPEVPSHNHPKQGEDLLSHPHQL